MFLLIMTTKIAEKCLEGNTNTSKQKKQAWSFTSFDESPPTFNEENTRYMCYGIETCPTTGKKHYQGYVYYNSQRTFSAVKKSIGLKAHIEPSIGDADSNVKYCSKEGKFFEFGSKPKQGKRVDLDEVKANLINGKTTVDEVILNAPETYHQYGRTLDKIEDIVLRRKFRTEMTEGIWYWGDTGVGKSHKAFEGFSTTTHYVVPNDNGWWDGYRQQDIVIINEFRGEIKYKELLDLCDKWPKTVPRRNREPMPFVSKRIIITSSLRPCEVFKNLAEKDSLEQLYRRFKVEELTKGV